MKKQMNVVVVGMKMDGQSRELLTWALVKVAQPGDSIVAFHVLPDSSSSADSVVDSINSTLAVYAGFCSLKQIDLNLSLCHGPSIRKALIDKLQSFQSAKLILGASKHNHGIGIYASTAKYCARKLSDQYGVVAFNSGKVVFQREGKNLTVLDGSNDNSLCLLPPKKYSRKVECKHNKSTNNKPMLKKSQPTTMEEGTSTRNKQSSIPSVGGLVSGLVSVLAKPLSETRPSWSLLDKKKKSIEKSKCSSSPSSSETKVMGNLDNNTNELESLHDKYGSRCRLFNFQELANATLNFSSDNFIGKGGNSQVYKGILHDGREVAVKVLKKSEKVMEGFVMELEIITALHHNNIISLYGFCFEDEGAILVYDLFSRGNLANNLCPDAKSNKNSIGWVERYKVAVGVAKALDYLHSDRKKSEPVFHMDVKSSNILLSDDFEPQVSDFGLSTWASSASSQSCTNVAGTFGYMAPEYFMCGKVSEKIDVYAFGVVLLELLSGRKPIENEHPKGQESIVMWAKPILQSMNLTKLMDPNLGSEYDKEVVVRMMVAAFLCIRRSPKLRPKISIVLKLLKGDEAQVLTWAKLEMESSEEKERLDVFSRICSPIDLKSHLSLAFLDLEDDDAPLSAV